MAGNDTLSNDDVDTLLDDINSQDKNSVVEGEADENSEVADFAFFEDDDKSSNKIPGFSGLNERFTINAGNRFTNFIHRYVRFQAMPSKFNSYRKFVTNLDFPQTVIVLHLLEQRCFLLLTISGKMQSLITNLLYGGDIDIEEKSFDRYGKLDECVAKHIVSVIMESLKTTWEDVSDVSYDIIKIVRDPKFINFIDDSEKFVTCQYMLDVSGHTMSFHLCFQMNYIETIKHAIKIGGQTKYDKNEEAFWRRNLSSSIKDARFDAVAKLPDIMIKLEELMKLSDGDVIPIENPKYADVYIQDKHILRGQCGVLSENRAVQITHKLF